MTEIRDQAAHFATAAVVLAPAMLWPSVAAFAWAGFAVGAVREVTEAGAPFTFHKLALAIETSKLDLVFWTLGAVAAALVIGV